MDKELLFQPRLAEDDVDVPGIGTFRVRGLTRDEVYQINQGATPGTAQHERRIIACGVIGPWELTEDEVKRWASVSPAGEIEPVLDKIVELSGLGEKADKEAMQTFREGPGSGVRVLPSSEAFDDSDGAASADEQ